MPIQRILKCTLLLAAAAALASAQPLSPPAETSVTIAGKNISIKYSAPSVRGRKIFSEDGILKNDATYPVWRAGANEATLLETSGNLMLGDLKVPAGKYSLYVLLDKTGWKLIVNKQTGQSGMEYDKSTDLGRVAMKMGKPPAMVEKFKITLSSLGGNKGRLTMEWENTSASVDFTVI
jgi:Protein of unknown function (DUF2911)